MKKTLFLNKTLKLLKFIIFTWVEGSFFAFFWVLGLPRRFLEFLTKGSIPGPRKKRKTLLIFRLDVIGDYLLFRNFWEYLRLHSPYKDYHIIFCGNKIVKDLAEHLDQEWVDEFWWVDRGALLRNVFYRLKFLQRLWQHSLDEIFYPVHSREYYCDLLVFLSKAKIKIAAQGDLCNIEKWQKKISDHFYDKLIPTSSETCFEFQRNKDLMEQLNDHLPRFHHSLPYLEKSKLPLLPDSLSLQTQSYVVIFPGAGHPSRQWEPKKWARVLVTLGKTYQYSDSGSFVLCGSAQEQGVGEEIEKEIQKELKDQIKLLKRTENNSLPLVNLIGKQSLIEVASLVAHAQCVLTNESMAHHLAQILRVPFICLSNGNHYLRFHPYPHSEFPESDAYIYPREMHHLGSSKEEKAKNLRFGSPLKLSLIEEEQVLELARKKLSLQGLKKEKG